MSERRIEQLYVFISRLKEAAPSSGNDEELARRHHAYLADLSDRGILFGSGSAKDETGKRHAGGVVILRASSLNEAREIAEREPYCLAGQRTAEVIPWQRTWFG